MLLSRAVVLAFLFVAARSPAAVQGACACPGPGCPAGGIPPIECRRAEARTQDDKKCPDTSCGELSPVEDDAACPCPGPGCPSGGWLPELSGKDAMVARCYDKALLQADRRVKLCSKLGYCRVPVRPEPPALLFDKDCPCPGPGCPRGGWKDADMSDSKTAGCFQKALESNPPALANDPDCPCPGTGCPSGGWQMSLSDGRVRACRDKSMRQQERMRKTMEDRLKKARAAIKIL